MTDPLFSDEIKGTTSTDRHRAVRYRAGAECGDIFEEDVEFDGLTLTIEVSGRDDALAMIGAISTRADLSDTLVTAAYEAAADFVDGPDASLMSKHMLAGAIRSLTPSDARTALAARDERIRREERERCVMIINRAREEGEADLRGIRDAIMEGKGDE